MCSNLFDPAFVPGIWRAGFKAQHFHLAVVLRLIIGWQLPSLGHERPAADSAENRRRMMAARRGADADASSQTLRQTIHSQRDSQRFGGTAQLLGNRPAAE